MISINYRRQIFWILDFLKGGSVKKHYDEILFLNQNHTSDRSNSIIKSRLFDLLSHVSNTVPYYHGLADNLMLDKFPIINKQTINENYESFRSSAYKTKRNIVRFTSGSTGVPFHIFVNKNKLKRHIADTIYYGKLGKYDIGNPLFFIRIWTGVNKKSSFKLWYQNIRPYSIFKHSESDLKNLLADLKKDKRSKNILSYASTCDALVKFMDRHDYEPKEYKIISIITDSDHLSNSTREKLTHYFKTPVFGRYGTMECGILGQQEEHGNHFKLNTASYYFEILDLEEDKPAKPDQLGRIVVTDLFNYCMPLIRYDTGDLCVVTSQSQIIDSIEGRKMDILKNTDGEVISPHSVLFAMEKFSELKQFQFVQKGGKSYMVRVNPWNTFEREEELIENCKKYVGSDAEILVEHVDEIPLMHSGKRKLVVNEYDKKT